MRAPYRQAQKGYVCRDLAYYVADSLTHFFEVHSLRLNLPESDSSKVVIMPDRERKAEESIARSSWHCSTKMRGRPTPDSVLQREGLWNMSGRFQPIKEWNHSVLRAVWGWVSFTVWRRPTPSHCSALLLSFGSSCVCDCGSHTEYISPNASPLASYHKSEGNTTTQTGGY